MPIHDWTRGTAGDFHHFHQRWIAAITDALNGDLPDEFTAMQEQVTGRPIPDVVTLQSQPRTTGGGIAVAPAKPSAKLVAKLERINYAKRKDRVVIRHGRGKVVAIIEVVSPGNKESANAIRSFVEKAADVLNQGIHLMLVDLFPPTPRDPQGIHVALMDQYGHAPFEFDPTHPLTVASYEAGDLPTVYVDPVAVGDELPSSPLFLTEDFFVQVPLERTYMEAWGVYPKLVKAVIDPPPAT
jgi:hypothetical protein